MEVKLAKTAGFCFGVKRAMEKVEEQIQTMAQRPGGELTEKKTEEPSTELAAAQNLGKIYTYGPIIHNNEVVANLKSRGVDVIENPEEIDGISGATLIIRSHGVAKDIYDRVEKAGVKLVDATCPFVKKIHKIAAQRSSAGEQVIIIGDRNHPEVQGIMGWCEKEPIVIGSEEEARNLEFPADTNPKICIVSQTTFNAEKFQYFVEIIKGKGYDTCVINTICSATAERQREAADISVQADVMLVIGDLKSSNTRKLYEICKSNCEGTYYIQTVKDLQTTNLRSGECVGITAGASTPNYLIQEVLLYVRGNNFQ